MKLLILISCTADEQSVWQHVCQNANQSYYLCPLSREAAAVAERIHSKLSSQHIVSEMIPFAQRLQDDSFEAKRQYIQWIEELGQLKVRGDQSLCETFRHAQTPFSYWWVSLVYEKSPGKSSAFLQFAKLYTVIQIQKAYSIESTWMSSNQREERWVQALTANDPEAIQWIAKDQPSCISSKRLLIREVLRSLKLFMDMFRKRIDFFILGIRKHSRKSTLQQCRYLLVTMFPYLDEAALARKHYVSKAYEFLQKGMDDQGIEYHWLGMHNKIDPYTWKDTVRLTREIKSFNQNFFLLDEWLGVKDMFKMAWRGFVSAMKTLTMLRRMNGAVQYTLDERTFNLWPLIQHDFISSFAGKTLVANLGFYYAFVNMARDLPDGAKVFHFSEMQAWEKCLKNALIDRPEIEVVGIQHTIVPLLLTNYFSPYHKPDPLQYDVQYPDRLACVGDVTRTLFLKNGWPEDRLFVLGGFRFQSLMNPVQEYKQYEGAPRLIAAFSILKNENQEILTMLYDAFNDGRVAMEVWIKSHPCESIEVMAEQMGLQLNPNVFKFTTEPLEHITPGALCMMAGGTSAIFYAVVNDVPLVRPYFFNSVNLCPVLGIYSWVTYIQEANELVRYCDDLLTQQEDPSRWAGRRQKLIQDYLTLPQREEQYVDRLKPLLTKGAA